MVSKHTSAMHPPHHPTGVCRMAITISLISINIDAFCMDFDRNQTSNYIINMVMFSETPKCKDGNQTYSALNSVLDNI